MRNRLVGGDLSAKTKQSEPALGLMVWDLAFRAEGLEFQLLTLILLEHQMRQH